MFLGFVTQFGRIFGASAIASTICLFPKSGHIPAAKRLLRALSDMRALLSPISSNKAGIKLST